MLETIEAAYPPTMEPSFTTPESAITFSKSIDRARSNNEWSSCIGRVIDSVEWCRDEFRLHLDNRKILRVACAQNRVDVTVEDYVSTELPSGSAAPAMVLLRFSHREIPWRRGELMESLRGHAVRRIQMSQTGLFLYVANIILWVNILIDRQSGRPFLFWELTD